MELIIRLIICYLLGSISGSIILGKIKKIDVRKLGSGNAGGTNAFRTMGPGLAICVLIIDILKGYIAVSFIPYLYLTDSILISKNIEITQISCALGVLLGHVYPLYHQFKGGKGAGPMTGVLLSLFPISLIICFLIWFLTLILSGFVGLSTILAGITFPFCNYILYTDSIFSPYTIFSIFISIFIVYTHRSNINRMKNGNENRFTKMMLFKKKIN